MLLKSIRQMVYDHTLSLFRSSSSEYHRDDRIDSTRFSESRRNDSFVLTPASAASICKMLCFILTMILSKVGKVLAIRGVEHNDPSIFVSIPTR